MNPSTPDGLGNVSRRGTVAGAHSTPAGANSSSVDEAVSAPAASPDELAAHIAVVTNDGAIVIEVQSGLAPRVAAWVLELVDAKMFDGTKFFRAGYLRDQPPRPRFLEGGLLSPFLLGEEGRRMRTAADAGLPVLYDWERTDQSGLRHIRGAVSLARDISGQGGVLPDFVIALETVAELDAGGGYSPENTGFPVFGRVVAGMDLVDAIAGRSRGRATYVTFLNGQILDEPAQIQRVIRTTPPAAGEA